MFVDLFRDLIGELNASSLTLYVSFVAAALTFIVILRFVYNLFV